MKKIKEKYINIKIKLKLKNDKINCLKDIQDILYDEIGESTSVDGVILYEPPYGDNKGTVVFFTQGRCDIFKSMNSQRHRINHYFFSKSYLENSKKHKFFKYCENISIFKSSDPDFFFDMHRKICRLG